MPKFHSDISGHDIDPLALWLLEIAIAFSPKNKDAFILAAVVGKYKFGREKAFQKKTLLESYMRMYHRATVEYAAYCAATSLNISYNISCVDTVEELKEYFVALYIVSSHKG